MLNSILKFEQPQTVENGPNQLVSTPQPVSCSSIDLVEVDWKNCPVLPRTFNKKPESISVEEALEFFKRVEGPHYDTILEGKESLLSLLFGNRYDDYESMLKLRKLTETKVTERYVWYFDTYRGILKEVPDKAENTCLILIPVGNEVYLTRVILKNVGDEIFPRTSQQSSKTTSPLPTIVHLEGAGLKMALSDMFQIHKNGVAMLNDEQVFFKLSESAEENDLVMKAVMKLSSEYLCKILKYGIVDGCEDWCLTVTEKLYTFNEIRPFVPTHKKAECCLKWFKDLLLGIKELHQNMIVHCDISYENVMLRKREGNSFGAVLIDFNNSLDLNNERFDQRLKYKFAYALDDQEFTVRSDIYSSGLTFCMFVFNVLEERCCKISEEDFVDECVKTIEQCKDSLIIRVVPLVKDMIKDRFDSVDQVLTKLDSILAGKDYELV